MLKLKQFYRDVLTGLNSMIFEKHSDDYDCCNLNIVNNEGISEDKILVTDSTFVFFIEKSKFPFDINAVIGKPMIKSNQVIKNILDDFHTHQIMNLYVIKDISNDKILTFDAHNRITNKQEIRKLLIIENCTTNKKAWLSMQTMKYVDLDNVYIFGTDNNHPFVITNKSPIDFKNLEVLGIIMPVLV